MDNEKEFFKLNGKGKRFIIFGVLGIIIISLIVSSTYTIKAGERGVLLTFGKADANEQSEGLHFKLPLIQKVFIMDVKTQKYEALASAASNDLQMVSTKIAVNYHLRPSDASEVFSNIGQEYQDRIVQPAVQEVVKAATAQFTAEQLIKDRPQVGEKIVNMLRERMNIRGLEIESISMTDFEFSKSFNDAIEAKVTAEQRAMEAKNKLAQIEYEAQQRITQANAEAEAIRIQAEAITAQGGKEYVQLQAIQKWNGVMPKYVASEGMPFLSIPVEE